MSKIYCVECGEGQQYVRPARVRKFCSNCMKQTMHEPSRIVDFENHESKE